MVFDRSGAPRVPASAGQLSATNDCQAKTTAAACVGGESAGAFPRRPTGGGRAGAAVESTPRRAHENAAAIPPAMASRAEMDRRVIRTVAPDARLVQVRA